jgi:thiamine-monophosphate kinase
VTLGRALRGVATSAMDVSDGLLGDLAKLASASSVGVRLDLERLPAPATLRAGRDHAQLERLILDGGDDYELLFTLPPAHAASVDDLAATAGCDLHCIGEVIEGEGVHGYRDGRAETDYAGTGHDHFA